MKRAIASAPGKILWLGGYALLSTGNVGFVTSVDKRVYARAEQAADGRIEFRMPQFGVETGGRFDGRLRLARGRGPDWRRIAEFVRQACEAALQYVEWKGGKAGGMRITTVSDRAFASGKGGKGKSGLGSSAATVTSVVACLLQLHGFGVKENSDAIHKLAQYAHSAAQGKKGSGFDVAASVYGTCAYSRYSPGLLEGTAVEAAGREWDHIIKTVRLPENVKIAFANIVGRHASTTEMVRKVGGWSASNPGIYAELMEEIDNADVAAIMALERGDLHGFGDSMERAREHTRRLGELSGAEIEPLELRRLADVSRRKGAFACRLPGAGGYDAIAAMCDGDGNRRKLERFWNSAEEIEIKSMRLEASDEGVRMERAMPRG